MTAMTQPRPALAALILLLFLSTAYGIERDPKVVREFMQIHPCPDGPDKGSKVRCAGLDRDHIIPLCMNGYDGVENLQWLWHWEHVLKTKQDVRQCAAKRSGVERWMDVR